MTITKEDAWRARHDECSINIDRSDYKFRFTRRWFKLRNQTTFSTFLPKRFPPDQPYKALQIGVFEGMDLVWCMQNIFCHPDSEIVAIDPWIETTKLDSLTMQGVCERAEHNLRKWRKQIKIVRGFSQDVLPALLQQGHVGTFDLIVIDGDHNAPAVYNDAIYSLELVKKGGWLLFDDVRNQRPKKHHVQEGLDTFMNDFAKQVRRVWFHRFCDCLEKI